ncbi:MAG: FG-GAP repeat protein [Ignavibacteria bacterium]|nr:FG-GAP repeat protein [Ignavibacteria bacterium]
MKKNQLVYSNNFSSSEKAPRFESVIMQLMLILLLLISLNASGLNAQTGGVEADNFVASISEKKDSLPNGVTKDWLNSLTDENGNRIIPEDNTARSVQIPEDPEGDAMQNKVFNGLTAGSYFGGFINTAGDVNGDGYDDIIVGAFGYDINKGRAYIYYGGLNMNSVPDVIMTGETQYSFFGSVAAAGDVNGDGYADVVIGAHGYSSYTGRTYIYYGSPSMDNTADVTISGSANSYLGYSVSTAGDVNGDGYADIIAGAYGYNNYTGRAYIYFGGYSMDNTADITLNGEASNDYFGRSVSTAGDLNGDGFSDVITGSFGYSSFSGRAYVYFGGSSMDNIADVIMTGTSSNFFGRSVSSAGDVNGDGYSDVIIGETQFSPSTGRAYIYFGGATMDNLQDVTMTGETVNDRFGMAVSSAGDINGDGYADVLVGAEGFSSNTGKAYIFFGGSAMNNVPDVSMTGEGTNNYFGNSVSAAGDVNGDGYSDVIAGAYFYNSSRGRVYMYDYFMKNEIIPDLSMTGEATINSFGTSVSSAGDVNGDGYSDVIVGASGYSAQTGRSYIFFGGINMNNTADVTMTGEAGNILFGGSVSSAGDVNGDGYSDVIIGASGYSGYTGRAYIYFGGTSMDNTADVIMTGESPSSFGKSVSSAGDVNGDGYYDVIVGANDYSSNTGRAYIYLGGSSMNNTADVIMTGEATINYFGFSVSTAGDVNGDGYSDVIVGANFYSSNTGRAYIFFGGASMNNTSDVTMTGETSGSQFGKSVALAGDVNGDGYSDVIVGADSYSTNTGRAYIFLGGSLMNNISDVTMTGEISEIQFGRSVSSAGDINGDGYSDIIAGANTYNTNTGRAYLYFGGSSMNNIADVTMTGEGANNSFGNSVSSAGDINGDGYPDLITGAPDNNSNTGKAYIYLGSAISAKPILNYVKDVPNDQGGKVKVKWARSSLDINGNNLITSYSVLRSFPPTGGNFAWQEVATITARVLPFYSYTDTTPYDSTSGNNGGLFYRIRANTGNVQDFLYSAILSGRSIDNIAPLMVSPFSSAAVVNDVRLTWKRSSAPDLLNYVLYRSTSPTINPNTEPVFATTSDSTYLDTAPLSGTYYYFIVAQDIHNNKSPVAVTENPGMTLNLTLFIEGFYDAGSNSQVSDTVTVELRNSTSPFAVADQTSAVVSANGTVQLKFGNAANGNYYIAVKHRNSIETWSAGIIALSQTIPASFDLSTSLSQAFGNNLKQADTSPVRFAIFSGDVNQDGTIDASDLSAVENDALNSVSGYIPADVTGDDYVDAGDLSIVENNASLGVNAVTP